MVTYIQEININREEIEKSILHIHFNKIVEQISKTFYKRVNDVNDENRQNTYKGIPSISHNGYFYNRQNLITYNEESHEVSIYFEDFKAFLINKDNKIVIGKDLLTISEAIEFLHSKETIELITAELNKFITYLFSEEMLVSRQSYIEEQVAIYCSKYALLKDVPYHIDSVESRYNDVAIVNITFGNGEYKVKLEYNFKDNQFNYTHLLKDKLMDLAINKFDIKCPSNLTIDFKQREALLLKKVNDSIGKQKLIISFGNEVLVAEKNHYLEEMKVIKDILDYFENDTRGRNYLTTIRFNEFYDKRNGQIGHININKEDIKQTLKEFIQELKGMALDFRDYVVNHQDNLQDLLGYKNKYNDEYSYGLKIGLTNLSSHYGNDLTTVYCRNRPLGIEEVLYYYQGKKISKKQFSKLKIKFSNK